jgi:hypothetical protein
MLEWNKPPEKYWSDGVSENEDYYKGTSIF